MTVRKIHLIAACGTGMGTLACMLKDKGYEVTGSDQNVYPPMSDFLREKGICLFEGYNERNLDYGPDLVIIGNAVKRDNCEAVRVMETSVPYLSMPQAIVRFFLQDRKVILVSGTHGKTTTASIMAWLLHEAGMDPSFLIGGIVKNFDSSYRLGEGEYFVIEGDEYDTAFFDKGPKFMHYDPFITIVTGIEFDHADIFDDLDHVKQVFHKFFRKLSPESLLVVPTFDPNINEMIGAANCRLKKFGDRTGSVYHEQYEAGAGKARFQISSSEYGKIPIETSLVGMHNMNNILCAACTLDEIQCSPDTLNKAMKTFSGIKRRQEVRGVKNGITVMDDFAHHPTAVRETVNAVKPFYKEGRVIAIFEPRTNTSMRKIFQEQYPRAFLHADLVCIKEPSAIEKIPEGERVCAKKMAEDIFNLGVNAYCFKRSDEIVDYMKETAKEGDLLLVMSNGGFDDIHVKLLNALQVEAEELHIMDENTENISMGEMEEFEWTEDLSVDIREIDELQKKMFALFNALLDLKEEDAEAKEFANMISEINEYAKYYFQREEEILRENKYPELELHSGEHQYFTKHTIALRRIVSEDKENLTYENIRELGDWLTDHIKEHDLLYVPFLRINRFIEEAGRQN